ncbi:hypothetical protein [Candidatus Nitrosocosmicus sp. R]
MESLHIGNDKKFNTLVQGMSIMLLPLLFMTTPGTLTTVNASSDDSVSCYERGIIDGEDHPFNQRTYDNCRDQYYQGFIEGCMSVDGNSRDLCESATDA